MPDIRGDLGRKVHETIVNRFTAGKALTTADVVRACAAIKGDVPTYFNNLVRNGSLEMQATGNGNGKSPWVFNWSRLSRDEATLRDALTSYLEDGEVEHSEKQHVRSALRVLFSLRKRCSDRIVLVAAEKIGAEHVISVPEKMRAAAEAKGFSGQSVRNAVADVRKLLRHAAVNGTVPLVFPRFWADDPWTVKMLEYFPREEDEEGAATLSSVHRGTLRYAYRCYREAVEALRPETGVEFADAGNTPRDLLQQVLDYLKADGEVGKRQAVSSLFSILGDRFGVGPRADRSFNHSSLYILPAPGHQVGGLEGFQSAIRHNGLPAEFCEFAEWLKAYETKPALELLTTKAVRRKRAEPLGDAAMDKRFASMRVLLGVALNRLNMKPEDLSVFRVFGSDYAELVQELIRAWRDAGVHEISGGLKDLIVHSGMVAYAAFRKAAYEAGCELSVLAEGASRRERRQFEDAELSRPKAGVEQVFLAAYEASNAASSDLTRQLKRRSPTGQTTNTEKDIRAIVRDTPPSYWLKLLDHLFAEIQPEKKKSSPRSDEFHELVLTAVITGIVVSTAVRQHELSLLHVHDEKWMNASRPGDHVIRMASYNRKNKTDLMIVLRERFLPGWLQRIYQQETIPHFKARGLLGDARGPRLAERSPADSASGGANERGLPYSDHSFLVMDNFGVPFGCVAEGAYGTNRNAKRHHMRVSAMGKFWVRTAASAAKRAGLKVPTGRAHFTLHCIRNSVGAWIRKEYGLGAAASYLGDTERTVQKYYSALDGQDVDLSFIDPGFNPNAGALDADTGNGDSPPAESRGNTAPDYEEFERELKTLESLQERLGWSKEDVARQVNAVRLKHGIGVA